AVPALAVARGHGQHDPAPQDVHLPVRPALAPSVRLRDPAQGDPRSHVPAAATHVRRLRGQPAPVGLLQATRPGRGDGPRRTAVAGTTPAPPPTDLKGA